MNASARFGNEVCADKRNFRRHVNFDSTLWTALLDLGEIVISSGLHNWNCFKPSLNVLCAYFLVADCSPILGAPTDVLLNFLRVVMNQNKLPSNDDGPGSIPTRLRKFHVIGVLIKFFNSKKLGNNRKV